VAAGKGGQSVIDTTPPVLLWVGERLMSQLHARLPAQMIDCVQPVSASTLHNPTAGLLLWTK
jgi:hypothetical protein